jgi:hypothetical protein
MARYNLSNGQTLALSTILSGRLSVEGRPVEFQQSEKDPLEYVVVASPQEGDTNTDEYLVTFSIKSSDGVINIYPRVSQDDPDFQGLTEAEQFTKKHSLEYQTKEPERTQFADGSMQSPIGIAAARSEAAKNAKRESFKKNSLNKEINSDEAIAKKQQEKKDNAVMVKPEEVEKYKQQEEEQKKKQQVLEEQKDKKLQQKNK